MKMLKWSVVLPEGGDEVTFDLDEEVVTLFDGVSDPYTLTLDDFKDMWDAYIEGRYGTKDDK
jgi:hypothetical protein